MQRLILKIIVLLLILANVPFAQARKFSFQSEDMAAYFRGTGGMSAVEQNAFKDSFGTASLSSEKTNINYGLELGFLLKLAESLNLRLGAEVLQAKVSGVKGSNASGEELFTLESDIFAFNPMATVEYSWGNSGTSRFVSYLGIGYANVRLENELAMTETGVTELSQDSYTEKSEGSFVNGVIGIGWEGLFVDNTTVLVDVGYRFLDVNKLKHAGDNPQVGGGNASKGSEVRTNSGSLRTFDLGGPFIGLSFRFYIDII